MGVRIGWKHGGQSDFHTRWLWYNAPKHRHPASGQRTLPSVALATHNVSIRGASIVLHDFTLGRGGEEGTNGPEPALQITWSDGSQSHFSLKWLAEHDYSDHALKDAHARAAPSFLTAGRTLRAAERRLPSAGTAAAATAEDDDSPPHVYQPLGRDEVPSVAYDDIMRSDDAVWQWLRLLNKWGLVLVTGAPTEEGTVLRVGGRIAPPLTTIYGVSWEVAAVPQPINIAYTNESLEPHIDLVYYEAPPGLQLLHCRAFDDAITGGASTFIDGLWAAEEFRRTQPEAFDVLCRIPATFQKVHYRRDVPVHIVYQRPHFVLERSGSASSTATKDAAITGVFWAPQFEGPLRVPAADVGPYMDAYAAFARLLRSADARGEHMIEFRMRPGDISVFNNRRLLHGRRHFTFPPASAAAQRSASASGPAAHPPSRLLQGCYISGDEFKSRLMHLCSKYGALEDVRRIANQCWY